MPFVGPNPVIIPATTQESFDQWKIIELFYQGNQLVVKIHPFKVENGVDVLAPANEIRSILVADLAVLAASNTSINTLLQGINSAVAAYAIANGVI